ncbi:MAG TPA: AAA family ATPase [Chthonomonadaceae bacterium]|nr:AAA family ATPase [Chthonomonadaceae bacterium]
MADDPRIADELRKNYLRLDSEGKLLSNAQLDSAYQAFRARFDPEKLQALDGEELLLTMHSRGDNNSLVYWLEFKNDEEFPSRQLGSIAGGSAHKFGIFYRQDKSAWMSGSAQNPQEITLQKAIEIARQQRDELVAGFELLARLPQGVTDQHYGELQEQMNRVSPTVGDTAWGHKYFSLLFPEKLDDFHSPDYQRYHLIRLLQMPPQGEGRYVCGGRFVAMAAEVSVRMNHLTHAINERDGRNPYRYWRIGTTIGEHGPSQWEAMQQGGYIAIGWDESGDLSQIRANPDNAQRKAAIKQLLAEHYADRYPDEGTAGGSAGEIHRFLVDVQEGDLILAADGAIIKGVGRVKGPYYYAPEGMFRHRRLVDWLSLDTWRMPNPEQMRSTVRQLWKYPANLLEAERRILGAKPIIVAPPASPVMAPVPSLDGIPARIGNVLERKGQVILYGPPGTGKTYWAEKTARELAARSWFGKAYDQLSENERALILGTPEHPEGTVRMCSFHPAYGYEDFLEGHRPEVVDGKMVFRLRDGIFKKLCRDAAVHPNHRFFLIIDEINRGDIPRIFGELLTVMEKNKRGQAVLLPLTATPFTVPQNLFIIGTMNTADRSIALLDAALRRRFGFMELMPDSQVLGNVNLGGLPLRQWFETINESVVQNIGRDGRNLQIGHSYFLTDEGQPISDLPSFARVLAEEVIPLLQEYCYEDYTTLERILGSGLVDSSRQRIQEDLFAPGHADELIQALIMPHPDLTTYIAAPAPGEPAGEDAIDSEEGGEEGEPSDTLITPQAVVETNR